MNLELDFTKISTKNPLLEKYSQPAFVPSLINDKATLHGSNFDSTSYRNYRDVALMTPDAIFDIIDSKEFARATSMVQITRLLEKLRWFDDSYGTNLRNCTDCEYKYAVTKSFNWKKGIYNAISTYINLLEKRHMRPAGIESVFKRIDNSRYGITCFKDRLIRLDVLRKEAKAVNGTLIDNLEDIVEKQSEQLGIIKNNTNEANQVSEYFDIYNYVNYEDYDESDPTTYLKLKLFTIVIAHPKEMTIVNNTGNSIGEILTPRAYLVFRRQLGKVLMGTPDYKARTDACTEGKKHPYINGKSHYIRLSEQSTSSSNLTPNPWGVLCLSSFNDDIIRSLGDNDYTSFVMGLSNWNSVYNIETTNPYNAPKLILYETGFKSSYDDEQVKSFRALTAFNTFDCFEHNLFNHVNVEDNPEMVAINNRINASFGFYSEYVLNSCNEKQCPLREECNTFKSVSSTLEEEDFDFMMESFVGAISENNGNLNYDQSQEFIRYVSKTLSHPKSWAYIFNNLLEINYWDKRIPEEEIPLEERMNLWMGQGNTSRTLRT